jgi:hypothetical protein
MEGGWFRGVILTLVVAASVGGVADARAAGGQSSTRAAPSLPANDLNDLVALTGVPTPVQAPVQENPEPALEASPRAVCGAGSQPLAGVQGRVPQSAMDSTEAKRGWTCNVARLGHHATPGGFRVWRYVDKQGHECAFYDTSLQSPLNVVRLGLGPSPGVAVLDMSDPSHPVQTATLTSLPMLFPHESVNLNTRRGLLAANMGNGTTLPGLMSIYDVSGDCRHPVEQATVAAARFGHESGFSSDGNTYWIAGGDGIAAVDVTDPKHPRTLWEGNVFAHGLNLSDDGNRLYDSDPINGNLVILDVSQIQARAPKPVVREISRLIWNTVSVPQNTAPMEINGKRYLLEFDEFGFRFSAVPPPDTVGGARIIDISDEAHPRVVSNIRLEVNQPAAHNAADSDPSSLPTSSFIYSAHYCAIPREVDPVIVACSFINSGLRIFNIQDPLHPREVAYYISPRGSSGDLALSQPAFVPERREVWYTDATTGFYSLRLDGSVWPTSLPQVSCAAPAGRLRGAALGPARLGDMRARVRSRFTRIISRGRYMDFFCLTGGAIRAGYPSVRFLHTLSAPNRRRTRGRVALLMTSNPYYALGPARPGARLTSALSRRLHLGKSLRGGGHTWFVAPGRHANGVLLVSRGVIREVGVADRRLTQNRRAAQQFLSAFR